MCPDRFVWHFPFTRNCLLAAAVEIRRCLTYCLGLLAQLRVDYYQKKPFSDVLVQAMHELNTLRLVRLQNLLPTSSQPFDPKKHTPTAHQVLTNTPQWCDYDYPLPPNGACLADSVEALEERFRSLHNDSMSVIASIGGESNERTNQHLLNLFRSHLRRHLLPACDGIWLLTIKIEELCHTTWSTEGLLVGLASTFTRLHARRIYSELINQAVAVNVYFPDSQLLASTVV